MNDECVRFGHMNKLLKDVKCHRFIIRAEMSIMQMTNTSEWIYDTNEMPKIIQQSQQPHLFNNVFGLLWWKKKLNIFLWWTEKEENTIIVACHIDSADLPQHNCLNIPFMPKRDDIWATQSPVLRRTNVPALNIDNLTILSKRNPKRWQMQR